MNVMSERCVYSLTESVNVIVIGMSTIKLTRRTTISACVDWLQTVPYRIHSACTASASAPTAASTAPSGNSGTGI